jgi:hypothetical protein
MMEKRFVKTISVANKQSLDRLIEAAERLGLVYNVTTLRPSDPENGMIRVTDMTLGPQFQLSIYEAEGEK